METINNELAEPTAKKKITTAGKYLLVASGGLFVGVFGVTLPFISPALRKYCLPYVPATSRQVENVTQLLRARITTKQNSARANTNRALHKDKIRVIDLGSGDGRLVIESAKLGARAEGVELNPWLVWYSRLSAWRNGVNSTTRFYTRDLWKMDLSPYHTIIIFGVEQMMPQLQSKLSTELTCDSDVIACRFPLPNWTASRTVGEGIDTVWLYKKHLNTDNLTDTQSK